MMASFWTCFIYVIARWWLVCGGWLCVMVGVNHFIRSCVCCVCDEDVPVPTDHAGL